MREHKVSVFTVLLTGALCTGALLYPLCGQAADSKTQLKSLQQDIAEKEKHVAEQKERQSSLQEQLRLQEKTIAQASNSLHETRQTLSSINSDISALTKNIDSLEKKQKTQQQILSKQLDAAFRIGQNNVWQLMLGGDDAQRSERILAYFEYINRAREQTINELKQTQTTLNSERKQLEGKRHKQKELLDAQQNKQQQLEQARSERKKTLSSLEAALAKDQQKLTELKRNEAQLRDKIARAEREAKLRAEREAREAALIREKEKQAKKSGSTYKPTESERSLMARTGGLGRPAGQAMWPVRGRLLHRFGEQLQGELRWKGMVISAPEGTEVRAIADGRVLLADWLQGYGQVVVLEHGKGDMSLYGYNQNALVHVGDQVKTGQAVALVGSSGGQAESALYFEIRRQGQAVNPQPWLGR